MIKFLGAAAIGLALAAMLAPAQAQSPRRNAPAAAPVAAFCPEGRTFSGACVPASLGAMARQTSVVLSCRASLINPCTPVSGDYEFGQRNNPLHRQSGSAMYYLFNYGHN